MRGDSLHGGRLHDPGAAGRRRLAALAGAVFLVVGLWTALTSHESQADSGAPPAQPNNPSAPWVGSWEAAAAAGVPGTDNGYPNYSIRNVVHTSAGGGQVRVRLSNAFGRQPLEFGHVSVAVAATHGSPDARPDSMRELTFGGAHRTVVPAGADVLSDPVALAVPADGDLLVTTFVPNPSGPVTYHPAATQTSFFTRDGDHAAETSGAAFTERTTSWHYVTEVDVLAPELGGSVLAFGDSITDGVTSTPGENRRWPDVLADRLRAAGPGRTLGVLNAGISANRLLLDGQNPGAGVNALARLDRDALSRTGVRTMVVLEGINDLQQSPTQHDPEALIAALRQLAEQAHARGVRVVAGTLTPWEGWKTYTDQEEAVRQAVNRFLRTGGVFDGVVDFDAVVRDPHDPSRFRPEYDAGDHLHPSDAGYRVMADAIDFRLL